MYQLQNIDYLYRISTMTGSSKLVTVQADRDSHDLNDKHSIEAHGDIDGDYWCTTTDKDLNRTIRECRTEILVDALLARGSEAVEEFLGYPVNMSEAECVLEEYLNNLSDEDLANAFFETL